MTVHPPSLPQEQPSLVLKAVGGIIIFAAVSLVVALWLLLVREYQNAEKKLEDRAFAGSQVVGINGRWIFELSHQALAGIDDALGPEIEANAIPTGAAIRDAVKSLPGNVKAYVVAADGRTLFSTDPNVKPIDIRDRPYFAELAKGDEWYTSSLLVSRLDNAQIFVFSKRIVRGGLFAGVAVISFDVEMLREIWASLSLDEQSTVGFVRDDGQLVARYPLAPGPIDLGKYVLFTDYLKKNNEGVYSAHSPADGVDRIVGYRRIPGTDLVALSSISVDVGMVDFRRARMLILSFAIPLAIGLVVTGLWILRLLRAEQSQRRSLESALTLNRLLVKDTHHRVKNNLQSIMSMVRMHDIPSDVNFDLQRRISAMSAVHEHLYRLDRFEEVDARTLIPSVVEPLTQSYDQSVAISYEIDDITLDRDQATPLALLVSEVATNALKYGLNGDARSIGISLKQDGSDLVFALRDNGTGFDPETASQGFGSRLIKALLIQLSGKHEYMFGEGTTFFARLKTNRP